MLNIRPAESGDLEAIWSILEPVIRAGDTYTLPSNLSKEDAISYWLSKEHEVFVAEDAGMVLGTYYLRANQRGGGSQVANCGYMIAPSATGRGVASAMCAHSLERARDRNFRAMQVQLCGEHQSACFPARVENIRRRSCYARFLALGRFEPPA